MTQKNIIIFLLVIAGIILSSCGPDEEEQQRREQARKDSLEQVRQDSMQQLRQQRQDSIAQAQSDTADMQNQNQPDVTFIENGRFSLQVESWRSQQKAQSRIELWKERGFDQATVVQHGDTSTGDVWFRVRLGDVESREAAEKLQTNILEQYQAQSWIVTN